MGTSVITHTETDPSGNAVEYVANFRLTTAAGQESGFRRSNGTGVSSVTTTTSNALGSISVALENNSNIDPGGSYYIAELLLPSTAGGTQEAAIISSSSVSPQSIYDALVSAIPSYVPPTTVPPTILSGNNTFTGINQFNGNVYFKSRYPWVDVKACGAVGDGLTDDTAAIQAALVQARGQSQTVNGITTYQGCIVYFPPGNYLVQPSSILIDRMIGLTLLGANSEGWSNYFNPVSSIVVDGAGTISTDYGIALEGAAAETVRNVHFQDLGIQWQNSFAGDLVRGETNGVRGFTALRCSFGSTSTAANRPTDPASLIDMLGGHHYRFTNCTFTDAAIGVLIDNTGGAQTNGWTFEGCSFFDFSQSAINCTGPNIKGLSVTGCEFDPVTTGTLLQYAIQVSALGFHISGCSFGGSDQSHSPTTAIVYIGGGDGVIAGNNFISNLSNVGVAVTAGQVDITGNYFIGRAPIQATGAGCFTERNNVFEHVTANAADIAIDCNQSSVAFVSLGPDRFTNSTGTPYDSSYKLPGTPIKAELHFTNSTNYDDTVSSITAYNSGGSATIVGMETRGLNVGTHTLTSRETGSVLTPASSADITLPVLIGGMEFTCIKTTTQAFTISRASTTFDEILDGSSVKTTLVNNSSQTAAVLGLRGVAGSSQGPLWLVTIKDGTWA